MPLAAADSHGQMIGVEEVSQLQREISLTATGPQETGKFERLFIIQMYLIPNLSQHAVRHSPPSQLNPPRDINPFEGEFISSLVAKHSGTTPPSSSLLLGDSTSISTKITTTTTTSLAVQVHALPPTESATVEHRNAIDTSNLNDNVEAEKKTSLLSLGNSFFFFLAACLFLTVYRRRAGIININIINIINIIIVIIIIIDIRIEHEQHLFTGEKGCNNLMSW